MNLIIPGLLTCFAVIILIFKMKGDTAKKLLSFDIWLDIGITVMLLIMFAGTFAGMMAAIVGGLAFSITLIILKKVRGYKKLVWIHDSDHVFPALKWIDIPPIWKRNRESDQTDELIQLLKRRET